MIPSPWEFALLALAAYRVWKLVADDAILDPLRNRIQFSDTEKLFVNCPWCLGFWVGLFWVACWWIDGYVTLVAAVPFAVSAAVGFVATVVDALTE